VYVSSDIVTSCQPLLCRWRHPGFEMRCGSVGRGREGIFTRALADPRIAPSGDNFCAKGKQWCVDGGERAPTCNAADVAGCGECRSLCSAPLSGNARTDPLLR
jgi:hypothetical protein